MFTKSIILEQELDIIRDYCETKSERAATSFVRKYQNFVYLTAFRYLQSHHDADDAAQEAFIKALNNLHKFREESNIKTWLYRITINICYNTKRKKRFFTFFSDDEENKYEEIKDWGQNPEEALNDKDFEEMFLNAINQLPEKQRETFSLRYFDQLSYDEISKMLGTSVGGLKANYFQAVRKLANYLKNEVEE